MPHLPPVKEYVSRGGLRIYRIPCRVFDDLTARVYLVLGAGVPTLVDAGSGRGGCTNEILSGIETVRTEFGQPIAAADVRRLIITHAHLDHFGGVAELLRAMPAEVAVHPLDGGPLANWEEHSVLGRQRLARLLAEAGVPPPLDAELLAAARYERLRLAPTPVGRWLADGDDLDGLRVIHAPGHSPGLVCLAADDLLLSADHILARTVPQQWPEQMAPYLGLAHYLGALDRIAHMPGFTMALAAHEPAIPDVYRRIEVIRGSQQRRLDRVLELQRLAARPLTVYELARKMYGELSGFRGVLALTDVAARVEYLHQKLGVRS